LFWPIPRAWRDIWELAKCRHPSSITHLRHANYVTGHREKPGRLGCDVARNDSYGDRCGPHARYWEARRYPRWVWVAGAMIVGSILLGGYFAFLLLTITRILP